MRYSTTKTTMALVNDCRMYKLPCVRKGESMRSCVFSDREIKEGGSEKQTVIRTDAETQLGFWNRGLCFVVICSLIR